MTREEVKQKLRILDNSPTFLANEMIEHLFSHLDEEEIIIDFLKCIYMNSRTILVATSQKVFLVWQSDLDASIGSDKIDYGEIEKVKEIEFLFQRNLEITIRGKIYYFDRISDTGKDEILGYLWARVGERRFIGVEQKDMLSLIFSTLDNALNPIGEIEKAVSNKLWRDAKNPIEKFIYGIEDIQSFSSGDLGKLIDGIPAFLREGEFLCHGAKGLYKERYKTLLVGTNQRLLLLYMGNQDLVILDSFEYQKEYFINWDSETLFEGRIKFHTGECFLFDHSKTRQYYEFYQYLIEKVHGESKKEEENKKIDLQPKINPVEMNEKIIFTVTGISSIEKMRQLNLAIEDEMVSSYLDELEIICGEIFSYVERNPEKEVEIRNFINYYLPQTFSLLEKYDRFSEKTIKTQSVQQTIDEIRDTLAMIVEAFTNLYNRLYENEALQTSVEIQALKNVLTQHGLVGESDPFELKSNFDVKK